MSNPTDTIFVKPAHGRRVRKDDDGKLLKPEGESVPRNVFWRRRIKDGDVIEVDQAAKAAKAK